MSLSTLSYAMLSQIRNQRMVLSRTRSTFSPLLNYNSAHRGSHYLWHKKLGKPIYKTTHCRFNSQRFFDQKLIFTDNKIEQETFDCLCKTEDGCLQLSNSIEKNSNLASRFVSYITKKHFTDPNIVSWEGNAHMFYDFVIQLMEEDPNASSYFSSLMDKEIFILLAKNNVQCSCLHHGRFLSKLIKNNPQVIKKIYSLLDRNIIVELVDDDAGRNFLKELIKKDIDLLVYFSSLVKKGDRKKLAKLFTNYFNKQAE